MPRWANAPVSTIDVSRSDMDAYPVVAGTHGLRDVYATRPENSLLKPSRKFVERVENVQVSLS